jgi:hypothetical protein
MSPGDEHPALRSRRWLPRLLFVVSAALAALMLRVAWIAPYAGVAALALIALVLGVRWYSRRRTRRLLRSGDVQSILERWSASLSRVPHANTMGPLMTATAFAAHGWTKRAREALRAAERGPAWDAALEHRLFVDALLLTFEGSADEALETASALERLPLPTATPVLVERIRVLRAAVAALARAFSHQAKDGDRVLMLEASHHSPLVHWAMRYGAAVLAVDDGDLPSASALLVGAPEWPAESCFNAFHQEIASEVEQRTGGAVDHQSTPS